MDVLDIGRLRKVNELAKTLTRHGLASNRLEAANLASELQADHDEMEALHHIQITKDQKMVVVNQNQAQQVVQQAVEQEQPKVVKDYYTKEEVETVLQDFANLFGSEVNKLKAELESLHAKLQAMQAVEAYQAEQATHSQVQQPTLQQSSVQESTAPALSSPSTGMARPTLAKANESHPRTGSFSAADVSIEKLFYFGTR
ncbi:hypothetical protein HYY69_02790 [Candidatus Woesearchaeota archaeon]|nr:hypothetical protein [Candidatus Woesearchaeota archaeon]